MIRSKPSTDAYREAWERVFDGAAESAPLASANQQWRALIGVLARLYGLEVVGDVLIDPKVDGFRLRFRYVRDPASQFRVLLVPFSEAANALPGDRIRHICERLDNAASCELLTIGVVYESDPVPE